MLMENPCTSLLVLCLHKSHPPIAAHSLYPRILYYDAHIPWQLHAHLLDKNQWNASNEQRVTQ